MEIYLVEKTTGNYDDRFVEIVKAVKDRNKAEEYVKAKEVEYEGIYEISKLWDKEWDPIITELEINFKTADDLIEFLKSQFPQCLVEFGVEKIKQAFDLYERGILYEYPNYCIIDIQVEE